MPRQEINMRNCCKRKTELRTYEVREYGTSLPRTVETPIYDAEREYTAGLRG